MRPITRITLTLSMLCLGLAVGGCADFDLDKVGEKLDVFGWSKKKPLQGDRQDVFPGGVPGVSQGVPPELMKGYQAPAQATPDPAEAAAAKAAQAEEPKPKPKPKKTAKVTPSKPAQQASPTQPSAPWPSQQRAAPQQAAPQQAQAPWPQQQQQAPQQSQSQAPWPSQQQQAPQQAQGPWPQQQPTKPWPTSSQ
jgi:hypothetical protein